MDIRRHLLDGQAIPALPLSLDPQRRWDMRHQRAILRYYMDAGTGGIAVGVHSTQFEIRQPHHALFAPLLEFASREIDAWLSNRRPFIKIAGLCGKTDQACQEAELARAHGYHAGLLGMAALGEARWEAVIDHCKAVAEVIPIIGFYLQTAVGGRVMPYAFWRRFADIANVVAIKIAPFNRYHTIDVIRAVMEAGRDDIALYTGNDDNIVVDLLTPWRVGGRTRFIDGGLLGQFGVWSRRAVELLAEIKAARQDERISTEWLSRNAAWTDANGAIFDAAHGFRGVICGIHEVLRRQGLMQTPLCLAPDATLSPGQAADIDRVCQAYPWLTDDDFVAQHRSRWLA